MSVLEDVQKLHITLKSFLTGLMFIMPFWYLDIYLFAPKFYNSTPIHIPIVLAFCISAVYFIPTLMISIMINTIGSNIFKGISRPFFKEIGGEIVFVACLSISHLGRLTHEGVIEKTNFTQLLKKAMWDMGIYVVATFLIYAFFLWRFVKAEQKNLNKTDKPSE